MRELLKGSLARRRRLVHTGLGVALAVGLVCGASALSATIDAGYRRALSAARAGASVNVRAAPAFAAARAGAGSSARERAAVPEDVLSTVRTLRGVGAAWGAVSGYARVAGGRTAQDGSRDSTDSTVGRGWTPADRLTSGRPPAADGEVVVGARTAHDRRLRTGDRVRIVFARGDGEFVVTGIGDEEAPAAVFELATAQALYGRTGRFDEIAVRSGRGVSPDDLRATITAALGEGYDVLTSEHAAVQDGGSWNGALRFLGPGLLMFSGLALLVSAFAIFNTFSILVGQRAQEFSVVRVLGAGRAQVMLSVLVEALVVGVAASAAGVVVGFAAAHGLVALLPAIGLNLPGAPVAFGLSTVAVGALAGVLVTVAAALGPAYRATAGTPLAAFTAREGRGGTPAAARRLGLGGGWVAGAVLQTVLGRHFGAGPPLLAAGIAALELLAGLAVLGPLLARPAARALGAPISRLFGLPALLGRENALRDPRRTATTASALMVGFGLIGTVCTLTASMRASAAHAVGSSLRADLVVSSVGPAGVPPVVAERLRRTPGAGTISQLRAGEWGLNGHAESLVAIDPATAGLMYALGNGDAAAVAGLDDRGVLVRDTVAAARGWQVGDDVAMTFARTGTVRQRLQGLFSTPTVRTDFVISLAAFEANYAEPLDARVAVKLPEGTPVAAGRTVVQRSLADLPGLQVMDRSEVLADQQAQVDRLLVPMAVLLALSVAIGLLGMANAVALSVHERTGELGLLRALGMDRRQLRSMIGAEAAIVAALGITMGLGLALFLSWSLSSALRDHGVTELVVPLRQLAGWAAAVVGAGIAAAMIPARRAARLDVLDAVRR